LSETERRKLAHIEICSRKSVEAHGTPGFEDIFLVHRALPEIDRDEVDASTEIFGHRFSAPILITGITGGTKKAYEINSALAQAAEELGLGMGVGSQRAALENPDLAYTFRVARERAPHAFLMANVGVHQLLSDRRMEEIRLAVDMITADALAIHLNSLQEAVQPEGSPRFRGILSKIEEVARASRVPVLAKETGAGIPGETAILLERTGVRGIDVSGVGGTSWAAVEYYRAHGSRRALKRSLGRTFWDWGVPTVVSLIEVRRSTKLTVVASGGVRTGLEAAKALALGADAVGIALPLLEPAMRGAEAVVEALKTFVSELETAMFLSGSKRIEDLRKVPVVVGGRVAEWATARGFDIRDYARRRLV